VERGLPNAAIIVGSFERGLGDWRDFAASPADRDALWGTVVVSIGSVIGALLIGVPLAFLLSRTDFRGRRILSGRGHAAGGAAAARGRAGVPVSLR
jgi:ABC-type Fe3+ transport system permease subunit